MSEIAQPQKIAPSPDELRRCDRDAWDTAYKPLWNIGMKVANSKLSGGRYEHAREDIVAKALSEVQRGLAEDRNPSFNQIASWSDVEGMMYQITRCRCDDFHRSRNLEDPVEEIPEGAAEIPESWVLSDLWTLVTKLSPPKPELFRDRFILGYSTDEIAAKRTMNRNTLCSHFANGLRQIREWLIQEDQLH